MSSGTEGEYSNLVAFLAAAGVVAPLVKRLKVSPILGFLAVGVVMGPEGLGRFVRQAPWLDFLTVSQPHQIAAAAELGVVFLLFSIGLELSWQRLRLMRKLVFGLGALETLISGGLIFAAALLLGVKLNGALPIAEALAMSSTALILPVMSERGRLHAAPGRAVFAILLFQDLMVAPLLIGLTLLGGGGRTHPLEAVVTASVGLVGIIAVGRMGLRPVFRSAARAGSKDLFMAASLLVIIGAGLAASLLGLSMALGAFIAGVLLAETEFRHEIEVLIGPFRDLLLGLFFVSVGVGLDIDLLVRRPGLILAVVAGMIAIKAVVGSGLARVFGLKAGAALETGLTIAAGGEFAFVIIQQAMRSNLLAPDLAQAMIVSATVSMFLALTLGSLGARLGGAHARAEAAEQAAPPPEPEGPPRVLVVGYGRVGKLVGEMLGKHDIAWVAIDRDFRSVEAARRQGLDVFYGDASRPEMLERLGLASAPGVVLTTDDPEAAETVTTAIKQMRPDAILVARARDARHARRLYALGATDAVPETIEASLQLSEAALVELGIPMGYVIASIHEKRAEIRKSFKGS